MHYNMEDERIALRQARDKLATGARSVRNSRYQNNNFESLKASVVDNRRGSLN